MTDEFEVFAIAYNDSQFGGTGVSEGNMYNWVKIWKLMKASFNKECIVGGSLRYFIYPWTAQALPFQFSEIRQVHRCRQPLF